MSSWVQSGFRVGHVSFFFCHIHLFRAVDYCCYRTYTKIIGCSSGTAKPIVITRALDCATPGSYRVSRRQKNPWCWWFTTEAATLKKSMCPCDLLLLFWKFLSFGVYPKVSTKSRRFLALKKSRENQMRLSDFLVVCILGISRGSNNLFACELRGRRHMYASCSVIEVVGITPSMARIHVTTTQRIELYLFT